MKKYFYLIVFVTCWLCSCSNEKNDFESNVLTDADVFVASEKFQNYQSFLKSDRKAMTQALKKMSKLEKNAYYDLVDSIRLVQNIEEYMYYDNKISSLLGYSFTKRILMLGKITHETFSGVEISKRQLLQAIQKYNVQIEKILLTRSSGENGPCESACYRTYMAESADCEILYRIWKYEEDPENEWDNDTDWEDEGDWRKRWRELFKDSDRRFHNWQEYVSCVSNANWNYDFCIADC